MVNFNQTLPPVIKEIKERFNKPINHIFETLVDLDVIETKPPFPKIIVVGDDNAGKTRVISKLVGVDLPREIGIPIILSFEYQIDPLRKIFLSYDHFPHPVKKEVSQDDLESEIIEAVKSLPDYWTQDFKVIVMQPYVSNLTVVLLPGLKNNPDKNHQTREIEIMDGYVTKHSLYNPCMFLHVVSAPNFQTSLSMKFFNRSYQAHVVTVITNLELCSESSVRQLTSKKACIRFEYLFVESSSVREVEKSKQVKEIYDKCDDDEVAKEESNLNVEHQLITREGDIGFGYLYVESRLVMEDDKSKQVKEKFEKHDEVSKEESVESIVRVDEESEGIEQAIEHKSDVFSKIDKKYRGYDEVAKIMVARMLSIIFSPFSVIYQTILTKLKAATIERRRLEEQFNSFSEALPTMISVISFAGQSLWELFVYKRYGEYRDNRYMHAAAVMADEFDMFYSLLQDPSIHTKGTFLDDEYQLLLSYNWSCPADCLSPGILQPLVDKLILSASSISKTFSARVFEYINDVVVTVLLDHAKHHLQLHSPLKMAARKVILEMQTSFMAKVDDMLDMEKNVIHTCQPGFKAKWDKLKSIELKTSDIEKKVVDIEGLGTIEVGHLVEYDEARRKMAFGLKMRMVCYWEFVVNRFVDYAMLNLMSSIDDMMPVGINVAMSVYLMKRAEDENIKLPNVEPKLCKRKSNLENRIDGLNTMKRSIEQKFFI